MAPRHLLVHSALVALAGTVVLLPAQGAGASATPPAGCTAAGGTVTCDYAYTGGTQSFTVPVGVTSVTFTGSGASGATGGFGGTTSGSPTLAAGGAGAVITETVPTTPGSVYTLTVGGAPSTDETLCASGVACKGGFNGGGNGGSNASGLLAGGGGGASTVSDSTSAVILAAGGGGGGGAGTVSPEGAVGLAATEVDGGAGGGGDTAGSAGQDGVPTPVGGGGGERGTTSAAGTGGAQTGGSGADGSGAVGGAGALSAGGGGGGGYFGGGGGGAGAIDHTNNNSTSGGGGGGGGSSFAKSGETPFGTNTGAGDIKVEFTAPSPILSTLVSTATANVGDSITDTATLTGGSNPTGQVRFDVFGPDDATCTGTVAFTSTADVSANGAVVTATSTPFKPAAAGAYNVIAHYLGDATDSPVDGICGESGESVVVSATQSTTSPATPTTTPATTTTPPTPTGPSTSVPPTSVTPHPLAYTGAAVGPVLALGAAAVSGGLCLLLIATARRRHRSPRQH